VKEWDAIGIGLAVRDISVLMDRYPAADEKRRAQAIHESGGGPVPTALVTLARFGRRTAISALVGHDSVGRFILEGLEAESVDTTAVAVREEFSSQTSVIIVENGRRTILEAPSGVGFPLSWDDAVRLPLKRCQALLIDARAPEVQLQAASVVRRAGGIVMLDCGHPREGVDALLVHTDIAIFSHTYPTALMGEDYAAEAFLHEMRQRLPENGPRVSGITLGQEGCAVLSDEGLTRVGSHPVKALDTTGAGDVFHGAYLHAFLKTGSGITAARFANVAAARKCEGMTGRAPLPPEEDLWAAIG
jgi:sulfofructose kinase